MSKQLISISSLFLVSAFAADTTKPVADATFSKDIAPILWKNCAASADCTVVKLTATVSS